MNLNKRVITLGLIILALAILIKIAIVGLSKIKIDDFKPAGIVFVIDSSASNQGNLPEQKKLLKQICNILDPEDQIKILRVSEDAYLIYEGAPTNGSGISKAMDAFTQYDAGDYGTAYGIALKKAFNHCLNMKKSGLVPAIIVIGDLENEGDIEKQIDWKLLPENVKNVMQYAPDLSMMFLNAHPAKLDLVKETLTPVLGETNLIVAPEQTSDRAIRKFLTAIGR